MKLPLILFLLSLSNLVSQTSGTIFAEDYNFEITVKSQEENPAKFDIVITGYTLIDDGSQIPFKLEQQDVETPYTLILKNGKYRAIIENKSKEIVMVSKVQGIKDGERMSSGNSQHNHTILEFGIGGTFAVSDR